MAVVAVAKLLPAYYNTLHWYTNQRGPHSHKDPRRDTRKYAATRLLQRARFRRRRSNDCTELTDWLEAQVLRFSLCRLLSLTVGPGSPGVQSVKQKFDVFTATSRDRSGHNR